MEKMKIFKVYIDDGQAVFKTRIPAFNENQAVDYCIGNGEVVSVKEETDFPGISDVWLAEQLAKTDMTLEERLLIERIVANCGLASY